MPFSPPFEKLRERVLVMGGPGVGKSRGWLAIADFYHKTKTPGMFYVIDTDDAIERMLLVGFPHLQDRVVVEVVYDWPEYMAAAKKFRKMAKEGDWIVLDMAGPAWEQVREYYVQEVMGDNIADYFLAIRKAMKAREDKAKESSKKGKKKEASSIYQEGLEGWKDWDVINPLYFAFIKPLVNKTRAHVYAATQADKMDIDREKDKANRMLFGEYGVKPRGQKHLGHMFHSILWLQHLKKGAWRITTIKDREREELESVPVRNFAVDYLVKVAKWKVS